MSNEQQTLAQRCKQNNWSFHVDGGLPTGTEVFVFGSNLAGIHGAGSAAAANVSYGAIMFRCFGHMGNSFAIPTKHRNYRYSLTLTEIKEYVDKFVEYTKKRHDLRFFVTGIGCGYAGYKAEDIAPMFKDAINCNFPDTWANYI